MPNGASMAVMTDPRRPQFLEFFAGGGMARLALEPHWHCAFSNDFDATKRAAYAARFGDATDPRDVWTLTASDIPGHAGLAWASSPCQDLSLAGPRGGMDGNRSSAFFGFWQVMTGLRREGRAPSLVVVENVTGLLNSRRGADFAALCELLTGAGYRIGALVLDASDFLPQSRPRLFIIAVDQAWRIPAGVTGSSASRQPAIAAAYDRLPGALQASWIDWTLPRPPRRKARLTDLLETDLPASAWRSAEQTAALIGQMDAANRARLAALRQGDGLQAGAVYRRTRTENGQKCQRAELRTDGLAGCLRTPGGGSSRQFLMICEGGNVRSRLMTPRETARLMGLPDDYALPATASAACRLTGDGVAVPVAAWLNEHLLWPLWRAGRKDLAA